VGGPSLAGGDALFGSAEGGALATWLAFWEASPNIAVEALLDEHLSIGNSRSLTSI